MLCLITVSTGLNAQIPDWSAYPKYNGNDLGLQYTAKRSIFKIWSPVADEAELIFYNNATDQTPASRVKMKKENKGVWTATVKGNQEGKLYVFRVRIGNRWSDEVPDPYAVSVGVNGRRAMVIDLAKTNPEGWSGDKGPALQNNTDAIIYELHIRDASIHSNSGITNKGKYLGLAERGTKNPAGLSTGLDHIRELGVTHVHLLPFFDFLSVDEAKLNIPQYNWGYEPLNYNVPEGSYATNAADGITRIHELKKMIMAMHEAGLGVVMDVVYNHTMLSEDSYFNELVPGYYYRQTPDGKFSDATACGNETASERPMMRKFMIESLKYWVREYHIDGFRFDLMGVHDIETMNEIARELRAVRPGILLYGEGWTAKDSPLPDTVRALKKYAYRLDNIAVFSDDLRDGIKGSVFVNEEKGFVSGRKGMEESIRFGVTAACKHPQVNYKKINYSKAPYSKDPTNTVSYAECHDNHVLWDKLELSVPEASFEERKAMYKLALSIVLTSQGISFLHAGSEFLRTKHGNENSYNAGDSINAIDWDLKTRNQDVVEYIKALIALRKSHPAFRLVSGKQVAELIHFLPTEPGTVAFTIDGSAAGDNWRKILVVYNSNPNVSIINVKEPGWQHHPLPGQIAMDSSGGELKFASRACTIYFME